MRSNWIRGAAALALVGCALAPAQAANVMLSGWAFGQGNDVRATSYRGTAGAFTGTLWRAGDDEREAFVTYSLETTEPFAFGSDPVRLYRIVDGDAYLGAEKADRLGRLMSWVDAHPDAVDTAAESTSLQLAIWNIVYDDDLSLSGPGVFRDLSRYGGYATSLLAHTRQAGDRKFDVYALQRRGAPDLLLLQRPAAAVPEPASAALALLALGALGVARRSQRGRRSTASAASAISANSARL